MGVRHHIQVTGATTSQQSLKRVLTALNTMMVEICENWYFETWHFETTSLEFGEILKICKLAEQAGKLGRPKILPIIFLYTNTEMCNLHQMLENTG